MKNKLDFIKTFYLNNNLKIFPVMENKKLPLIDAWQKDCSSDFLQVLYWLENAKNCNFGLPANENDLFIIDIDMHDVNGLDSWNRLCADLNVEDIDTLTQTTPSGGIHYIFRSDNELKEVMNSANCFKDYQGIDIRTKGYILCEPSVINGVPYKMNYKEIKDIPKELKEFIINNNAKEVEIKKEEYVKPEVVEKGGRDTKLFEYINQLYYRTKLDRNEITLLSHYFNNSICKPPLPESTIEYKVKKMFCKPRPKMLVVYLPEEEKEETEKINEI